MLRQKRAVKRQTEQQGRKRPKSLAATSTSSSVQSDKSTVKYSAQFQDSAFNATQTLVPYSHAIISPTFRRPPNHSNFSSKRHGCAQAGLTNQAKSLGGIYELPAMPSRSHEAEQEASKIHPAQTYKEGLKNSKNKILPGLPGETRRWI